MTEDSYNRKNIKVLKIGPKFILGKCQCGYCDDDIPIRTLRGILSIFKHHHQRKGKDSPVYKGLVNYGPYKVVRRSEHPNAKSNGYVLNHRLVYEHYLKILFDEDIYIPKNIDIHHIIPIDEGGTDALINLTCLTKSEHMRYHKTKDMSDRICRVCGSDKTRMIKLGDLIRPKWYGSKKDGYICFKCHDKDPIVRQRATQLQRERRKRQRLQINTLDKYSD